MKINFEAEYELNRGWIFDEDEDTIGETNFIVSAEWLEKLYNKKYANKYSSLDDFLDVYEPEEEGEFIYQEAIKDGTLKEDLGVVMYDED